MVARMGRDHGGETQPGSVAVQFQGWVTLRRGDRETARACAKELMDRATQLGTVEYLAPAFLLAAESRRGRRRRGCSCISTRSPRRRRRSRRSGQASAVGRAHACEGRRADPGGQGPRRRHRRGWLVTPAPALLRHRRAAFEGDVGGPGRRARPACAGRCRGGLRLPARDRAQRGVGSARCLVKLGRADARARLAQARPTFRRWARCPTSTTWRPSSAPWAESPCAPRPRSWPGTDRSAPPADPRRSAQAVPARRSPRRGSTRGAMSRAKPISWVAISIVMPAAASSRMTSSTSATSSGSSALVPHRAA